MAPIAQELRNLKHTQDDTRQEEDDDVDSRPRATQSNDTPSLKLMPAPPSASGPPKPRELLRLTDVEENYPPTHNLEAGLAERIPEEVRPKISEEYTLTFGYNLHKAQKHPFHPYLLREPFPSH